MRTVGMFKTKVHLPELIRQVERGEELCITNRGKKVAFIIPVGNYYKSQYHQIIKEFLSLKKKSPIGGLEEIIKMKEFGKK